MLHHFNRPSGDFARIFAVVASMLFSNVAIGQTNTTDGCPMPNDVPPELANISAALNVCAPISKLHANGPMVLLNGTPAREEELRTVRLAALVARRHIDQAALIATQLNNEQINALRISALVIGALGAGVGGGLHLVNNPHVGHAATVLSMTAGVTGAGINLVPLVSGKKGSDLSADVQRYIRFSANRPRFPAETLSRHRSQLLSLLIEMGEKVELLQNLQ